MNRNTPQNAEHRSTPFGDALRELRTARDWSQAQLADKIHWSRGHLVNVENGLRRPSIQLAEACDEAFRSGDRLQQLVPRPQSRSTGMRPMQLPPVPGIFIGRTTELSELDQRLGVRGRGAGVAVSGPAGIGKTWLCLHWADRVRDSYPDGFLYADLHGNAGPAAYTSCMTGSSPWAYRKRTSPTD
jgi:transcriptional regulator with XRE-family HTH domain